MLGLLDDRLSAMQSVLQDEIYEVGIFERCRPQERRLLPWPEPALTPGYLSSAATLGMASLLSSFFLYVLKQYKPLL